MLRTRAREVTTYETNHRIVLEAGFTLSRNNIVAFGYLLTSSFNVRLI